MAKKTLREYMNQNEFFYVPEIYDCISTRAAEMNGFQMVMISSSDFACSQTGIPDLNLLSVDEYCHMIERITYMTDMPLFVDADEGFGRPLQTYHGCKRMARAGADCILIANDDVMKDELRKTTIKMAKPQGVKLVMKSVEDGIAAVNSGVTDKYKLFIVVESIQDAYRFATETNVIKSVNLGGTKAKENTRNISKAINVTEEETTLLKELVDKGIEVEIRMVPNDAKVHAENVL